MCDKYVGVFIVILRVANAYDGNLRWELTMGTYDGNLRWELTMGTLKQKQQQQIKGNKGVFLIRFIVIIYSGRL